MLAFFLCMPRRGTSYNYNRERAAVDSVTAFAAPPAPGAVGLTNIGNTWYLRPLATATETNWTLPTQPGGVVAALESTASDYWGNDVDVTSANIYFCTHLRLTQLIPNELVRAEVRVWWYRHGGVRPTEYGGCGLAALNTMGADTANVHWVHLTQVIARHQL
jgi:hypothetical protein